MHANSIREQILDHEDRLQAVVQCYADLAVRLKARWTRSEAELEVADRRLVQRYVRESNRVKTGPVVSLCKRYARGER